MICWTVALAWNDHVRVVLLLQDERENGEQALSGIRKTHEKMKNELRGRIKPRTQV